MSKQIIAAGGDALTDIPLHHYILAQSDKEKPRICFLPTASGDNEGVIKHFFFLFREHNCTPDYLPLFHNKEADIREFILSQDIILVAGGQSKSMMGVWKEWGVDKFLMEAYENGTIMSGGSAGSVCWFDECITDSFKGTLSPMKSLGFLPFSNCPHYRAHERRVAYRSAILERKMKPGYAVSDGAAIHFKDGKFLRAVSSDSNASSFFVDIDARGKEEKIHSERLPTSWLGSREVQDELIWNSPAFRHMVSEEPEPTASEPEVGLSEVMD
jgi:dipeptidase E